MSFTGGKLKLKGGETLQPAGGVKKKKKKSGGSELALQHSGSADAELQRRSSDGGGGDADAGTSAGGSHKALDGTYLKPPSDSEDRRTAAEKKHDERVRAREEARLKAQAQKSHKDRVREFNEYLTNLSEHHDIPKVGPG